MKYLVYLLLAAAAVAFSARTVLAAPAVNPCSLLSLGEAQAVTHFSLTASSDNPLRADRGSDPDTGCTYMNDKSQMVSVAVHDDPAYFPGNAKAVNTEGFKRLNGIGDRAWSSAMAMAASIDVLKNGKYVSVRVADPDGLKDRGARNYADAIKLAKLVAARL